MQLNKLEGIVPNRRACFDLLILLENEYNCSLKFWLDVNNPQGGESVWTVYCAGSGHVWDHPDLDGFVASARVLDADSGNIYRAIWAALLSLEHKFRGLSQAQELTAHP